MNSQIDISLRVPKLLTSRATLGTITVSLRLRLFISGSNTALRFDVYVIVPLS